MSQHTASDVLERWHFTFRGWDVGIGQEQKDSEVRTLRESEIRSWQRSDDHVLASVYRTCSFLLWEETFVCHSALSAFRPRDNLQARKLALEQILIDV